MSKAQSAQASPRRFQAKSVGVFLQEHMMYVILAILLIFFAFRANNFFTWGNIRNIINQSAYLLIIGVGMCPVMLAGCMDLSIGYQISTIGVIGGVLMSNYGMNWVLVSLIMIGLGVFFSLINGVLYVRLKVFPFLITLATQYVFNGLTYIISGSKTYSNLSSAFKFIGQGYVGPIPFAIILMVVCLAFGIFLLNKTYFGRYVYGLGGNEEAVALAGVNVRRMKLLIFAMEGLFIGLGTVALISRTGSATSTMGPGLEFTVIAGGFLGGISPDTGKGKMSNIIIGLMILQVLSNGMQLMQMGVYPQYVAKGLVLILALCLDYASSARLEKDSKMVMASELDTSEYPEPME